MIVQSLPVNGLIKFYADWCAPCNTISPSVKNAANDAGIDLLEVDIDVNPEIADRFGVNSLPTVIVMREGKAVEMSVGAHGKQHYVDLANKAK